MNRVDSAGVLARMSQLGHVVRRSYSVQAPLSLGMGIVKVLTVLLLLSILLIDPVL